jgi:predicted nucleotidyltransferase
LPRPAGSVYLDYMAIREEQLVSWAQPLSETQDTRCEKAVSEIQAVLRARFGNDISFIRQGSHKNRTNIRHDSDVDIAVVYDSHFWPELSALSEEDKELHRITRSPGTYPFSDFKRDVHTALEEKFGSTATTRKNKCIQIAATPTRITADVVPAFGHRRFRAYDDLEVEGIEFVTDAGVRVSGFPEQHYANGVAKNTATSRAYKSVVRILKHVRRELTDKGLIQKDSMPSFFLESLVWNASHGHFFGSTWKEVVPAVALEIRAAMKDAQRANSYAEVSDLRWLFRGSTSRTPKQAEDFMLLAWDYIEN